MGKSSDSMKIVFVVVVGVILVSFMFFKERFIGERRYQIYTASEENKIEAEDEFEDIYVHICGEVKNPGVIKVDKGMRLFEAIEKCGGFTDNADKDALNLAQIVVDGNKYYIPDKNMKMLAREKVNINTASKKELMKIDGIGAKTAEKIIRHREKNGMFSDISELKSFELVSESKFEDIKEHIIC